MKKHPILILTVTFLTLLSKDLSGQTNGSNSLTNDAMLDIVKRLDKQFSEGIRNKDSVFLSKIYAENARYVQPKRNIIVGRKAIEKDWGEFLRLGRKPIDLVLNIESVNGTREVIYEIGTGYTLFADSSKWEFNYVNVWQLDKDSTYKLVIDTYNQKN